MNKVRAVIEKIKRIKHIHIYLALVIGLFVCAIYFSTFSDNTSADNSSSISTETSSSTMEYVTFLENKLSSVLKKVDGAKSVDVAITLDGGISYVYATDTETKTIVSGSTQTTLETENIILVSNEPVVVEEIYPKIKGVIVVCEGAKDVSVKLNIINAVVTALGVDSDSITVLA